MQIKKRIRNKLFNYYFPSFLVDLKSKQASSKTGIVLMYHEVLPDNVSIPAWTVLRESDFIWQMEYLKEFFDIISISEAYDRVNGLTQGERPFAVITFDDGYQGNFTTVLPIMEKMKLPFTVYIATQAINQGGLFWYDKIINLLNYEKKLEIKLNLGNKEAIFKINNKGSEESRWTSVQQLLSFLKSLSPDNRLESVEKIINDIGETNYLIKMLSVEQTKQLSSSSFVTIGSHTHGHELLDQLDEIAVQETITAADNCFLKWLHSSPQHFAYPNGNYNSSVIKSISKAKFKTATTTKPGYWTQFDNQFEIPRLPIGRFITKSKFRAMLAGFF